MTAAPHPAAPPRPGVPRALLILLALAAGVVVLLGMQAFAGLIVPVFLALNLIIAVHPVGSALTRRGLPPIVGSLVTMLIVLLALVGFFVAIAWAVAQLIQQLPFYADQFNSMVGEVLTRLAELGIGQEQVDTWLADFNFASLFGLLNSAVSSVGAIGALLAATFATIIFFGLDAAGLPQRLALVRSEHAPTHRALLDFALSVRTYWIVTTVFGAVVAVIDGLALWALGVPLPAVWAVLLFLCNYIPNIGFVFAMIPPTLMALLAQGPWTAVLVVVICTTVAMLLQGLVQPRVTGRAVGVSASVSFLSVLFWSWVLGAAGALLSVPMTLLVKELLVDADPRARWANAFLADTVDAAVEPPANRVGTGPSPTESAAGVEAHPGAVEAVAAPSGGDPDADEPGRPAE